jgi:beta-lactamase class A
MTRAMFLIMFAALFGARLCAQDAAAKDGKGGTQSVLLWEKLQTTVQHISHDLNGTMGVVILDLTDGIAFRENADQVFAQASSIKVGILAELYRQEQQSDQGMKGKARLSDVYTVDARDLVDGSAIMSGLTPGVSRVTNRDLATFMVAVSDNSATNVLIERLGMQNVNALLDSLGLRQTRLQRKMMDVKAAGEGRENISTPNEMTALFRALFEKKVLNEALTKDFFRVLGTPKQSDIPRYIPEDVVCANKPGELEGVRNDVGIVFVPGRPFVVVVMTAYLERERDGDDAIAKIAGAAYEYFDRVARSSGYGRVVSARTSH